MKQIFRPAPITVALALAGAFGLGATAAHAGAIIFNNGDSTTAALAMGINNDGSLNTSADTRTGFERPNVVVNSGTTGIAYRFADGSFHDATSPGCYCEGWGVSVNGTTSGYADVSVDGTVNLTYAPITGGSASSATAITSLTSLPGITVTQTYSPSTNAPGALFRDHVTITNTTGSAVTDLKYVRVMDWDIPPTEFNEYVTIKGTATTTELERSHLDGFASANPLSTLCEAGCGYGSVNTDVTDAGPTDHGAYFRFNFGSLADGASKSFDIFYGAAGNESSALAAIGAESLELYSLGQSNGGQITGEPATFIFGFAGVGGTPVEPPPTVPEPASLALLGAGLIGIGAARRRRVTA